MSATWSVRSSHTQLFASSKRLFKGDISVLNRNELETTFICLNVPAAYHITNVRLLEGLPVSVLDPEVAEHSLAEVCPGTLLLRAQPLDLHNGGNDKLGQLFIMAKLGRTFVQLNMKCNLKLRHQISKSSTIEVRTGGQELISKLKDFAPKLKTFIKDVVHSQYFIDCHPILGERFVQEGLSTRPMVITPSMASSQLFMVFVRTNKINQQGNIEPSAERFPINISSTSDSVWACPADSNIGFKCIYFDVILKRLINPPLDKYPRQSDGCVADTFLEQIWLKRSMPIRYSLILDLLASWTTVSVATWCRRGITSVLTGVLRDCQTNDPSRSAISKIFSLIADDPLCSESMFCDLLSAFEGEPQNSSLIEEAYSILSNHSTLAEKAVKWHVIQRLIAKTVEVNRTESSIVLGAMSQPVKSIERVVTTTLKLAINSSNDISEMSLPNSIVVSNDELRKANNLSKISSFVPNILTSNQDLPPPTRDLPLSTQSVASIAQAIGVQLVISNMTAILWHRREIERGQFRTLPPGWQSRFHPVDYAVGWEQRSTIYMLQTVLYLVAGLPPQVPIPINPYVLLNSVLSPVHSQRCRDLIYSLVMICDSRRVSSLVTSAPGLVSGLVDRLDTLLSYDLTHERTQQSLMGVMMQLSDLIRLRQDMIQPVMMYPTCTLLFSKIPPCLDLTDHRGVILFLSVLNIWSNLIQNGADPFDTKLLSLLTNPSGPLDIVQSMAERYISDQKLMNCHHLVIIIRFLRSLIALNHRVKNDRTMTQLTMRLRFMFSYPHGILYTLLGILDYNAPNDDPQQTLLANVYDVLCFSFPLLRFSQYQLELAEIVSYHFTEFLKVYLLLDMDANQSIFCQQQLAVLLSICHKMHRVVERKFHILGVATFLAGEMSLESDTTNSQTSKPMAWHLFKKHSGNFSDGASCRSDETNEVIESTVYRIQDDAKDSSGPKLSPKFIHKKRSSGESKGIPVSLSQTSTVVQGSRGSLLLPRLHLKSKQINRTDENASLEFGEQLIKDEAEKKRSMKFDIKKNLHNQRYDDDNSDTVSKRDTVESQRDTEYQGSVMTKSKFDTREENDLDDDSSASFSSSEDSGSVKRPPVQNMLRRLSGALYSSVRRSISDTSNSPGRSSPTFNKFASPASLTDSRGMPTTPSRLQQTSMRNLLKAGTSFRGAKPRANSDFSSVPDSYVQHRYFEGRRIRNMYRDTEIHARMMRLLLHLMISRNGFTLNRNLINRYPTQLPQQMNLSMILHRHMNFGTNERAVQRLGELEKETGLTRCHPIMFAGGLCILTGHSGTNAYRLLRLLSTSAFTNSAVQGKRLAKGRFGSVYECTSAEHDVLLATKVVDLPQAIDDYCVLPDLYSEITILEKFRNEPHICYLYDYGVSTGGYHVVMALYPTSLRQWRIGLNKPHLQTKRLTNPNDVLPQMLQIYQHVLNVVAVLHDASCIHFDLKCDNFLIRTDRLMDVDSIDICLTDFGESMMWDPDLGEQGHTVVGRGTENIQAPEILSLSNRLRSRTSADRDGDIVSKGADVWAVGCLLYELLTADYLFEELNGLPIFFRVVSPDQPIILESQQQKLTLMFGSDIAAILIHFMDKVLVRSVKRRLEIHQVNDMFQDVKSVIFQMRQRVHVAHPVPGFIQSLFTSMWKSPASKYANNSGNEFVQSVIRLPINSPARIRSSISETAARSVPIKKLVGVNWTAAYESIRDALPEQGAVSAQRFDQSVRRITSHLYLAADHDVNVKDLHRMLRLGINRIAHCGASTTSLGASLIAQGDLTLLILGGEFAGELGAVRPGGRRSDRQRIRAWIDQFALPFVVEIRSAILDGHVVLVCGSDWVSPSVVTLLFLMTTYRVTLFESMLALRQKRIVSCLNPILTQILSQVSVANRPFRRYVAPSGSCNARYGCLCGRTIIVVGNDQHVHGSHCACEVGGQGRAQRVRRRTGRVLSRPTRRVACVRVMQATDDVDCPGAPCRRIIDRANALFGARIKSVRWARLAVADVAEHSDVGRLVRSGDSQAMKARQAWTNFACASCDYTMLAVEGSLTTLALGELDPAMTIAVNTSRARPNKDRRPVMFYEDAATNVTHCPVGGERIGTPMLGEIAS